MTHRLPPGNFWIFFLNISQKYLTQSCVLPGRWRGRFPPPGAPDSGFVRQQPLSAFLFLYKFDQPFFVNVSPNIYFPPQRTRGWARSQYPPPGGTQPDTNTSAQFHLFFCTKKPSFFCKYLTQIFTVHAGSPRRARYQYPPWGAPRRRQQHPFFFFRATRKHQLSFFINISTKYLICTQAPGWARYPGPPRGLSTPLPAAQPGSFLFFFSTRGIRKFFFQIFHGNI